MKQHLIFSGPVGSGKTHRSRCIAANYNINTEVVRVEATEPIFFFQKAYAHCTPQTKLIILDPLVIHNREDAKFLRLMAVKGFTVSDSNKREWVHITPRVLAVGQELADAFRQYPELLEEHFTLEEFE